MKVTTGTQIGRRLARAIIFGVAEGLIGGVLHAIDGAADQLFRWECSVERVDEEDDNDHIYKLKLKDHWGELPEQKMEITCAEYEAVHAVLNSDRPSGAMVVLKRRPGRMSFPTRYARNQMALFLREAYEKDHQKRERSAMMEAFRGAWPEIANFDRFVAEHSHEIPPLRIALGRIWRPPVPGTVYAWKAEQVLKLKEKIPHTSLERWLLESVVNDRVRDETLPPGHKEAIDALYAKVKEAVLAEAGGKTEKVG